MQPTELKLESTTADRLIDLRHLVLRQGLPREDAIFPGDDLPTSLHVLASVGSLAVGCATYHVHTWNDQPAWRLRGMATHPGFQRQGIGKAVLDFAERELLSRNFSRQLWCNARLIAVPFYKSLGWTIESGLFNIPTAGPHHKMAKRLNA